MPNMDDLGRVSLFAGTAPASRRVLGQTSGWRGCFPIAPSRIFKQLLMSKIRSRRLRATHKVESEIQTEMETDHHFCFCSRATPHFSTGFWDFFDSPNCDGLQRPSMTVYVPSTTFQHRLKSGKNNLTGFRRGDYEGKHSTFNRR